MKNITYYTLETILQIVKSLDPSKLIVVDNEVLVELINKYNPACNVIYKRDELHRYRDKLNLTDCEVIILLCCRESTVEFIQTNYPYIQLYVIESTADDKQLEKKIEELENLTPLATTH